MLNIDWISPTTTYISSFLQVNSHLWYRGEERRPPQPPLKSRPTGPDTVCHHQHNIKHDPIHSVPLWSQGCFGTCRKTDVWNQTQYLVFKKKLYAHVLSHLSWEMKRDVMRNQGILNSSLNWHFYCKLRDDPLSTGWWAYMSWLITGDQSARGWSLWKMSEKRESWRETV